MGAPILWGSRSYPADNALSVAIGRIFTMQPKNFHNRKGPQNAWCGCCVCQEEEGDEEEEESVGDAWVPCVCRHTNLSRLCAAVSLSLSQTLALCCWTHSVTVVVVVCCLSSTLHIYLDTENGLSPSVLRQCWSLLLQLVEIQMFVSAKVRDVFNKLHFLLIKDLLKKSWLGRTQLTSVHSS